jgi:hypothetical protein
MSLQKLTIPVSNTIALKAASRYTKYTSILVMMPKVSGGNGCSEWSACSASDTSQLSENSATKMTAVPIRCATSATTDVQ